MVERSRVGTLRRRRGGEGEGGWSKEETNDDDRHCLV